MKTKVLGFVLCSVLLLGVAGCNKENAGNDSKEEETTFNLNDNIEVFVVTLGGPDACGFSMFTTNLSDVFPEAEIKDGNRVSYWEGSDTVPGEIAEADLANNISNLVFDTEKEENAKNLLETIQRESNSYSGVREFSYSYDNHRFRYDYQYIRFKDSNKYHADSVSVGQSIEDAFADAIEFQGPCGSGDYTTILTEELCDEYNLSCERR